MSSVKVICIYQQQHNYIYGLSTTEDKSTICTPSWPDLGFVLMTSWSWQYISCNWDACSNHYAISDLFHILHNNYKIKRGICQKLSDFQLILFVFIVRVMFRVNHPYGCAYLKHSHWTNLFVFCSCACIHSALLPSRDNQLCISLQHDMHYIVIVSSHIVMVVFWCSHIYLFFINIGNTNSMNTMHGIIELRLWDYKQGVLENLDTQCVLACSLNQSHKGFHVMHSKFHAIYTRNIWYMFWGELVKEVMPLFIGGSRSGPARLSAHSDRWVSVHGDCLSFGEQMYIIGCLKQSQHGSRSRRFPFKFLWLFLYIFS